MALLLCFSLISIAFIYSANSSTIARAVFYAETTGIEGEFGALNGFIWYDLDFTAVNWTALPEDCADGGLKWHLHTEWTYGDSSPEGADRIEEECAAEYTGGHWDPWFACGSASASADCLGNGGCIPPSSIFELDNNEYYCDPVNYALVSYTCEVGDWSGKYGTINAATWKNDTQEWQGNVISETYGSYWETDRVELSPDQNVAALYSLVLHCNTGERVFCAPILRGNSNEESVILEANQPIQTDFSEAGADYDGFTATFTADGLVVDMPESTAIHCNEFSIAIYDLVHWPYPADAIVDCDTDQFLGIYDPTHTCIDNSGSPYCQNGYRCPSTSNTSADYYCGADNDYFGCAVGDISARAGNFFYDVNLTDTVYFMERTLVDPKSPALYLLDDKAIVFTCVDVLGDITNICSGTEQNGTDVTLQPANVTRSPTGDTTMPTKYPTDSPIITPEPTKAPIVPVPQPTKSPITDGANVNQYIVNIMFIAAILSFWM